MNANDANLQQNLANNAGDANNANNANDTNNANDVNDANNRDTINVKRIIQLVTPQIVNNSYEDNFFNGIKFYGEDDFSIFP